MAKPKEISSLSYDKALEELESIVQQLEAEVGDLDAALALYERGQALSQHCSTLLEQAELRVQQLGSDGELTPLD
ncbi:MAG TPA: exodeoxyribonuclease VII small subunit [Anaerolineales bacterium]|nr:exodeoxyribonuclease VII small subunit [Anaerolineales bacterium]HRQ91956.1 exodeoxyribonuclease VII small subunit [Anaerolineales bacterium]